MLAEGPGLVEVEEGTAHARCPAGVAWTLVPEPCSCPQLVLAEGAHSDAGSQGTDGHTDLPPPLERTGGIGDSRPPSFQ